MKPVILILFLAISCNGIAQNANSMNNKQLGTENLAVNFRYIVKDIDTAVTFYTEMLGFHAEQHVQSAFANLSLGNFHLFINQPGAGGAGKAMTDGTVPAPGGWNRILITVDNLEKTVKELKSKGASFRNDIVTGVGGKQILLQDPSGNLIELFEAAQQ